MKLPVASTTLKGVVDTSAQGFSGEKTLNFHTNIVADSTSNKCGLRITRTDANGSPGIIFDNNAGEKARMQLNATGTSNDLQFTATASTTVVGWYTQLGAWTLGAAGGTEMHFINGSVTPTKYVRHTNANFNVASNGNMTSSILTSSVVTTSYLVLQTATAPSTIHGIINLLDGVKLYIINNSGQSITLANESATETTSSCRIRLRSGANEILANGQGIALLYSSVASRWIAVG